MPDFESEFESQFDDSIMAEFLLDSDEGSPLPDRSHSPCAMAANAPEDYGSPSEAFGLASNGSQSMNSSYGSMLDSQSSKRTTSTSSTSLTGNGAGATMDWGVPDILGDAADGFATMGSTFNFPSASATAQSDLCSPTCSPGPFASGLNALPLDTTNPYDFAAPRPSTRSEAALSSFRTSCGGGLPPFAYGPTAPAAVSGALTEAPSAPPTALCMRPSQSIPPLLPGYGFRSSQDEAGTIATSTSETFGMSQSAAGQVALGNPFNGVGLPAPVPHPFSFPAYGLRPYGLDVDANNSKSRVETQIAIKLRLPHLPPGIKRLHLPKHTISKPKFWTKPPAGPSPDMLELHTVLVCTSAMQVDSQRVAALQRAQLAARPGWEYRDGEELKPQDGGEVQICENCIGRERKRAGRKKLKNLEDELAWEKDEARRVIVFNTHEVKDWTPQDAPDSVAPAYFQVEAPMRIACYCRHHAEKLGFQIIFTLTDYSGQVVDQTLSPSIMITDDHKSTSPKPMPGSRARKPSPTQQGTPAQDATYSAMSSLASSPSLEKQALRRGSASSTSIPDLQQVGRRGSSDSTSIAAMPTDPLQPTVAAQPHKNSSRPPSPSLSGAPAKRRKANRSVPRVSSDLAMTRLDTAVPRGPQLPTPATSPFLPNPPAAFRRTAVPPTFGDGTTAHREPVTSPFGNGPQTAGSNGQLPFPSLSRTASLSNLNVPAFGPPPSARPNPAASPNAARPSPLPTNGEARTPQTHVQPAIFKVIPEQGSVMGGTEVTLIGLGFHKDMHVMFGDRQSTVTTHWSSGTLTCIVPPSDTDGLVQVTLRGPNEQPLALTPERFFRYVDDSDQQLLRTALMILNIRMGGWSTVDDFAREIISSTSYPSPGREMAALERSSSSPGRAMCDFENQLLKVLELMHQGNSTRMPRLNLRRWTGHTMLHLACKLGLQRFVARLLERGAHADLRDNGGYTALHMASISNHAGIVRLLMSYGADPTLRTLSGLTAHDVATSDQVRHILDCFERRRRSQSSSKAHSRVNSAASLKSLRAAQVLTPLSRSQPAIDGASSGESELEDESPESEEVAYESDVADASGSDGELPGLLYLRGGKLAAKTRARGRSPARLWREGPDPVGGTDEAGGTDAAESIDAAGGIDAGDSTDAAESTDAASARGLVASVARRYNQVSDQMYQLLQLQLLQLQQTIRPQNLQLPPLPNMNPLPDYQAALRQITTMIAAYRTGSEEGEPTTRAAQEKPWVAEDTPPPAYDELFPQNRDLETKQASAAQAAAEAEADAKCAALYDRVSPATTTVRGGAKVEEEEEEQQEHAPARKPPVVLQLGRKGAITPEQQAAFRWRRAENLKRLNWDLKLFFFWIPTLTIMVSVMIYTGIPGFAANRNWAPWPGRDKPYGVSMADVRVGRETTSNIASAA